MSSASRSTSPTIHTAPTSNGALGSSLKRLPLASSSSNTSASKQVGLPFFLCFKFWGEEIKNSGLSNALKHAKFCVDIFHFAEGYVEEFNKHLV